MLPIKLNYEIKIYRDDILEKYQKMDEYYKNCLKALYGEKNNIDIHCFLPYNIIKKDGNYNLSILDNLIKKTGVYIFLNNENIPVYIGIGGNNVNGQNLKERVSQELRVYVENKETTSYSKDSGATLSKNIREIESLLSGKKLSPDESIDVIRSLSLLTIVVGKISDSKSVDISNILETILIALFHPKYNK